MLHIGQLFGGEIISAESKTWVLCHKGEQMEISGTSVTQKYWETQEQLL